MIIDSLPYILQLIKQNLIISTLVLSNGKTQPDLKGFKIDTTGSVIQIYTVPLSSVDSFDVSFFVCKDAVSKDGLGVIINVDLTTNEEKYFKNSEFYFGRDEESKYNLPTPLKEQTKRKKTFGIYKIYDEPIPPAFVSIVRNPIYGYKIFLTFYTDYKSRIRIKETIDQALKKFYAK